MKKTIKLIAVLCITALLFSFSACGNSGSDGGSSSSSGEQNSVVVNDVVIIVSGDLLEITDKTTLLDYMNALKKDGELEFEVSGGMITSINGIANPADYSSCWMLYTSDDTQANTAWGTIKYTGGVYSSAVLGAEALVIKEGYVYIWSYVTF